MEVTSGGEGYDVINPPLHVALVGTAATGVCAGVT